MEGMSNGGDVSNCNGGSDNSSPSGVSGPSLVVVPEGGLWTAVEVADFLSVSADWVWKQVRLNSGFPFIRLGNRNVRFDPAKVRAWVEAQSSGGPR
jgi:predicted DNA-binding transcriptional regulator AlpA